MWEGGGGGKKNTQLLGLDKAENCFNIVICVNKEKKKRKYKIRKIGNGGGGDRELFYEKQKNPIPS